MICEMLTSSSSSRPYHGKRAGRTIYALPSYEVLQKVGGIVYFNRNYEDRLRCQEYAFRSGPPIREYSYVPAGMF
jgi:hypothetical protein